MADHKGAMPPDQEPKSGSGCAHVWWLWVIAYLIPGIMALGIKEHFRQQEVRQQQEVRNQQMMDRLRSAKPEEMGEATRMLLGMDPPEKAVLEEDEQQEASPDVPEPAN